MMPSAIAIPFSEFLGDKLLLVSKNIFDIAFIFYLLFLLTKELGASRNFLFVIRDTILLSFHFHSFCLGITCNFLGIVMTGSFLSDCLRVFLSVFRFQKFY